MEISTGENKDTDHRCSEWKGKFRCVSFHIVAMKVMSINIRGLGGSEKKSWIRELCAKEKINLMGIQETKQGKWCISQITNLWGVDDCDYIQSPATGNSGGLILVWDKKFFNCDFFIVEKSFVAAVGKWVGSP